MASTMTTTTAIATYSIVRCSGMVASPPCVDAPGRSAAGGAQITTEGGRGGPQGAPRGPSSGGTARAGRDPVVVVAAVGPLGAGP